MEWNGINRGEVLRSINTLNCWETPAHPLESVSFSHFVLRLPLCIQRAITVPLCFHLRDKLFFHSSPARQFNSPARPSNAPLRICFHLISSSWSTIDQIHWGFVPCEVHQIDWPETSFTDLQKLEDQSEKETLPSVRQSDRQTVEQKMPVKSNAGETMAWSESVDTVLSNKEGLAAFRTFLKSEFSEENVEFWLACEDFKKTKSSTKIALKAQKIYSDFIEADAPKEINIDFHTKNDISQNISEPTLSCFDAAQSSVYCLMAKDSFPRFLRSEVYKELVKKHQDRNQKRWLPFL